MNRRSRLPIVAMVLVGTLALVLRNQGAGTLASAIRYAASFGALAFGDLDGDLRQDLVTSGVTVLRALR